MTYFPAPMLEKAASILNAARGKGLQIATAESCTGGLLGGCFTEIPNCSDVYDRGFIVYSYESKADILGVDAQVIKDKGAVSAEVAVAMAEGALERSNAQLAVAITGVAGPGADAHKPAGLVHFALASKAEATRHVERRFGDLGRSNVRSASVNEALDLLKDGVERFDLG